MLTLDFQGLFALERRGQLLRRSASLSLAALAHAGLAFGARYLEAPAPRSVVAVTEIEVLPLPLREPEAPAPPSPEPEAKAAEPAPAKLPRARPLARPAPAPSPAAAGKLLTADEAAPSAQEPVRFVTDPNGGSYGIGVVARGGTAAVGAGSRVTSPTVPETRARAPSPSLSRPPQLSAHDPCRGFFPASAQVDRGAASVLVHVSAAGRVSSVRVVREQPSGQGFGAAAQRCLRAAQFGPALDTEGRAVDARAPVTVRFSR